jgi:hypothetical protein
MNIKNKKFFSIFFYGRIFYGSCETKEKRFVYFSTILLLITNINFHCSGSNIDFSYLKRFRWEEEKGMKYLLEGYWHCEIYWICFESFIESFRRNFSWNLRDSLKFHLIFIELFNETISCKLNETFVKFNPKRDQKFEILINKTCNTKLGNYSLMDSISPSKIPKKKHKINFILGLKHKLIP